MELMFSCFSGANLLSLLALFSCIVGVEVEVEVGKIGFFQDSKSESN